MKSFLLGFLLVLTTVRMWGDAPATPSFILQRGDALKVSVERLGSHSNDNARLSFVLIPQKANEYLKFTRDNMGKKMEVILTDFKNGTRLMAHPQIPGQSVKDGAVSLVYPNVSLACDDAKALMDSSDR
jgi:hypothetical protein